MIDSNAMRAEVQAPVAAPPPPVFLKLDLGCGQSPREGFQGVDLYAPGAIQVDLLSFPWPWADASVDEVHISHFLEHIPRQSRLRFFDELYRVLKPGCLATVITPCGDRHSQDPTHEAPEVVAGFYCYINRAWREANKLTHGPYAIQADFDHTVGVVFHPLIQSRNDEFRGWAGQFYKNAVTDLWVTLVRR